MFNNLKSKSKWLMASLALAASAGAWSQEVTVVEYHNQTLDSYFITGREDEQRQLDAIDDFRRTGMTFQAPAALGVPPQGSVRICRFYISNDNPFASTHFYGREGTDCEMLLGNPPAGFSWEGYDFAVEEPTDGVCAANRLTIYRSFRPSAGGKTSNHRYSASLANYEATRAFGYSGEGAAFCVVGSTATSATPR